MIIPINLDNAHWALAVVDPTLREIKYYDSYHYDGRMVMKSILDFLQQEHHFSDLQFDSSSWKMQNVTNIPLQTDGSSCGPMMILAAECIGLGKPFSFTQNDVLKIRKKIQYILITEAISDPYIYNFHEN